MMTDHSLTYFNASLLQDLISNSPYCLSYNSHDVSIENLFLDLLIIPELMFFYILITSLLNMYWYCKEKFCLGHTLELKD